MVALKKTTIILLLTIILLASVVSVRNCSAANGTSNETVALFLTDVAGIDLSKWEIKPQLSFGPTPLPNQPHRYILSYEENTTDVVVYFSNDKVRWCKLHPDEGLIPFIRTADNPIDLVKTVLEKYQTYSGASYVQPLLNSLHSITKLQNTTTIIDNGNIVMKTEVRDDKQTFEWMRTTNGISNNYDNLVIYVSNGALQHLGDNWNRYTLSNLEPKISLDRAIELGREASMNKLVLDIGRDIAVNYSFVNGGGHLTMQPRDGLLVPQWELWIDLDKTVKTYSNALHLLIWADTGELAYIGYAMSYGSYPVNEKSTTTQPSQTVSPSLSLDNAPIAFYSPELIIGIITIVAITFAVGSTVLIIKRRHK